MDAERLLLKPKITKDLSSEEVVREIPRQYHERAELSRLRGSCYHLIVFPGSNQIVLSGAVRRTLDRLAPDGAEVVVAAPGFTTEALELLRTHGAIIYTLGDFEWTDASLQAVRQATRLPREET